MAVQKEQPRREQDDMKVLFRATIFTALLTSCAALHDPSPEVINNVQFHTRAEFGRNGYISNFPITNGIGEIIFLISCYSLDDESREEFAHSHGTDPVADLSCYVKDTSRKDEHTVLGLEGESLQFTPAFFWFSEINKCDHSSYKMEASVRGAKFSFVFSNIDINDKVADLDIIVTSMPSAMNENLIDHSYRAGCT